MRCRRLTWAAVLAPSATASYQPSLAPTSPPSLPSVWPFSLSCLMRRCCLLSLFRPRPFVVQSIWRVNRYSASRPFHPNLSLWSDLEMEKVPTTARLAHLRKLMKAKQIDIYSMIALEAWDNFDYSHTCSCPFRRQSSFGIHRPGRCAER